MTEASGRPAQVEALLSQGKAEIEWKTYDAAIETFNRALELQPGDVDLFFYRGLARLRKADYAGAVEDYSRLLERNPEHGAGRYNRGYCLQRAGKHQEADEDFTRYLQKQPDDWEALLERGLVRLLLKQPAAAKADLDRADQVKPERAGILFHRGRAWMAMEKWEPAIADFERALKLDADYTNVYFNRAWCNGKLGNHAAAVEDYTKYLEINPKDTDAYLYRGNRRFDLCDLRGTLADYEKAVELNAALEKDTRPWIDLVRKIEKLERDGPNEQFVAACCERGVAKRDNGENATALLWFDRALEVDPNSVDALHGRALTHLNLGKNAEAIQGCTRAIEIRPDHPNYWHDRGRAKRTAGDKVGALADFSRALELKADFAPALAGRGYTYILLEDFAAAAKDYQRYVEIDPKSFADTWYNLGWARRKLGQHAEAVEAYTRAIEINSTDGDTFCQRGYARRDSGDKEGARADFRKAVELKPDLKEAVEQAIAAMDAPAPAKPVAAPQQSEKRAKPGAPAKPVPASWGAVQSLLIGWLISSTIIVLLGISGIPVLGDIPRRAIDMPYKAAWIIQNWNNAGAFPPKCDLCIEPFCTRADTSKKYVGGRDGYTSQVYYKYCPEHKPSFFSMGVRFDGFLYFVYWGIVLVTSLVVVVPALSLALHVACWPVLLPLVLARKIPGTMLFPSTEGNAKLDAVFWWTAGLASLAGWIMFAWW